MGGERTVGSGQASENAQAASSKGRPGTAGGLVCGTQDVTRAARRAARRHRFEARHRAVTASGRHPGRRALPAEHGQEKICIFKTPLWLPGKEHEGKGKTGSRDTHAQLCVLGRPAAAQTMAAAVGTVGGLLCRTGHMGEP